MPTEALGVLVPSKPLQSKVLKTGPPIQDLLHHQEPETLCCISCSIQYWKLSKTVDIVHTLLLPISVSPAPGTAWGHLEWRIGDIVVRWLGRWAPSLPLPTWTKTDNRKAILTASLKARFAPRNLPQIKHWIGAIFTITTRLAFDKEVFSSGPFSQIYKYKCVMGTPFR